MGEGMARSGYEGGMEGVARPENQFLNSMEAQRNPLSQTHHTHLSHQWVMPDSSSSWIPSTPDLRKEPKSQCTGCPGQEPSPKCVWLLSPLAGLGGRGLCPDLWPHSQAPPVLEDFLEQGGGSTPHPGKHLWGCRGGGGVLQVRGSLGRWDRCFREYFMPTAQGNLRWGVA